MSLFSLLVFVLNLSIKNIFLIFSSAIITLGSFTRSDMLMKSLVNKILIINNVMKIRSDLLFIFYDIFFLNFHTLLKKRLFLLKPLAEI